MARRAGESLFEMAPVNGGRRHRALLWLTMLVVLVFVLFTVFQVLPLGPDYGFSNRRARKLLADAERWEGESLYLSACEILERICSNPKVHPQIRVQAAVRLARICRVHMDNPRAAEAALEKAYYYSPQGPQRETVRRELEALRGTPVQKTELTDSTPEDRGQGEDQASPPSLIGTVIAQVGGETATLEEILYTWSHFYGHRNPAPEEFDPFVKWYLDLTLIADEAHRRGLDRRGRGAYDLRLKRLLSLNETMTQLLIEQLPQPSEEALQKFYEENITAYSAPARATIGHIVVDNARDLKAVEQAVKAGKDFQALAKEYSLDASVLENGYLIGEVSENDQTVPRIGTMPGLAGLLVEQKDGATTGPLRSSRGFHWIKTIKHKPPQTRPLDEVKEQAMMDYQKAQLELTRRRLIDQLRKSRPIVLYKDKLQIPSPSVSDLATSASENIQTPVSKEAEASAARTSTDPGQT